MTDDDPVVYLTQPSTPRERVLGQVVDLREGDPVPFGMFAAVAVRLHDSMRWIGTWTGLEAKIKRRASAGILTLLANVVLVGGMVAHSLKASGAAEEREVQRAHESREYRERVQRDMDRMEQDIRDLRRDLRRLSGTDRPMDSTDENPDPDKFSLLDGSSLLLTAGVLEMVGDKIKIRPRTCGDTCSSSIECTSHFGRVCPFCSFGRCSASRPEEPKQPPPDAGIDAAPGGTTP